MSNIITIRDKAGNEIEIDITKARQEIDINPGDVIIIDGKLEDASILFNNDDVIEVVFDDGTSAILNHLAQLIEENTLEAQENILIDNPTDEQQTALHILDNSGKLLSIDTYAELLEAMEASAAGIKRQDVINFQDTGAREEIASLDDEEAIAHKRSDFLSAFFEDDDDILLDLTAQAPTSIEVLGDLNGDGFFNAEELGPDGTVTIQINLATDATAGDTVNVGGKEYTITQADIDAGYVQQEVEPGQDVEVFVRDSAGNVSASVTISIPVADVSVEGPGSIEVLGDTNNDGVFNKEELGEDGTVTVKVNFAGDALAGDVLTVNGKDTILTQDDINRGYLEVEVAPGENTEVYVTDIVGNKSEITNIEIPEADVTVDSPSSIEVLGDTNNDGVFNKEELGEDGTVTVKVNFAGDALAGDVLTVNGKDTILTQDDINRGSLEVEVDPSKDAEVYVTDIVGNKSEITNIEMPEVDTTVDSPSSIEVLGDTNNDGVFNKEELGEDGTVTVKVNFAGDALAGDVLTVNGKDTILTQDDINRGSLEVEVDPSKDAEVYVTDIVGNKSEITNIEMPEVDTTASASDDNVAVVEDTNASVNGNLLDNDADAQSVTNPRTETSEYGTFVVNSDGTYSYTLNSDAQALKQGETLQETFTYEVTDAAGNKDTATVTIDITGTNDAPVLDAISQVATSEDAAVVNGQITSSDIDDSSTATYTTTSNVPGFTLNPDGTYSFDPSDAAYQDLDVGDTTTLTIPVKVTDEHGATDTKDLVIKVSGTNDAPVLDAISQVATSEDAAVVNGQITSSDIDDSSTATYTTTSNVPGFTLNPDGTYSFDPSDAAYQDLDVGDTTTLTIPVKVTDEHGATDTKDLVIKVSGTNDAPVLDAISQVATSEDAAVVNGQITSSDIDDSPTATYSTTSNVPGFTLNPDGTYSFDPSDAAYQDLDVGDTTTLTIPVKVTDEHGATDTKDLVIKVSGTNDAPVLDAISQVATSEDAAVVNGQITSSDIDDSSTATYTTTSNVPGFTLNPDGTYSFDPSDAAYQDLDVGDTTTLTIPVKVTDEHGATDTKDLVIKVSGTNDAPVLDAISQVATSEDAAVVNGQITSSDIDDSSTATYTTTSNVPGFTLNPDGTYSFDPSDAAYQDLDVGDTTTLTIPVKVTDEHGATDTKDLVIKVSGTNDAPVLDAISQVATSEDAAVVNGQITSSDIDDSSTATYTTTSNVPGFTLNPDGTYSFDPSDAAYQDLDVGDTTTLTIPVKVTDEHGATDTKDLVIKVSGTNDAPVLDAISQVATSEDAAVVNGQITSSDIDDSPTATYSTTSNVPGFTLNPDGTYSFDPSDAAYQDLDVGDTTTLTIPVKVTDEHGATDTKDLVIKVSGTNDAPVLDAISQVATSEDAAVVNGQITSSDIDDSSTATYTTTSNVPGFTLNPDGTYSFDPSDAAYQDLDVGDTTTLTIPVKVTDEHGATDTKDLVIKVSGTNDAPVLDAISQVATSEDAAVVNGQITSSDIDDSSTATYTTTSNVPGFTLNPDGTYSFDPSNAAYQDLDVGDTTTLTIPVKVTDEHGATDTKDLVIKVSGTNDAPVLDAISQVATSEDAAVVNGQITSSDIDDSSTATYSTTSNVPGFTLNPDGTYSFDPSDAAYQDLDVGDTTTLTIPVKVTDEHGATDTKDLVIKVSGTNDVITQVVDTDSSANEISENVVDGTYTGVTVSANDVDADDNVTYSIPNDVPFKVESDGRIVTDGDIDFETAESYTFTVTATSSDGTTSTQEVTINVNDIDDTIDQVTADISDASDTGSSNSDNITKDNTPTITGTTEAGAVVVITDAAGNEVGRATANGNGEYSITTTALNDGTQDLTIKATDAAGNESTTTQSITVDTGTEVTSNVEGVSQGDNTNTVLERPTGLSDIENVDTDNNDTYDKLTSDLHKTNDDTADTIEINEDQNGAIYTYGGDDTVNIDGNSNRNIHLGEGNNRLDIDGNSDAQVTMGSGDDQIKIGGNTKRNIDLKDGDNVLDLGGNAGGDIYAGRGDDTIIVDGTASGRISTSDGEDKIYVEGDTKLNVDAGKDNDEVTIKGDAKGRVYLGEGDDTLNIGGDAKEVISADDGNDTVIIDGAAKKNIDLGDGNDTLHIKGETKGRIYAGEGDDKVILEGPAKEPIFGGSGVDSIELKGYTKADWDANKDGIQSNVREFENIKFADGEVIGDSTAFEPVNSGDGLTNNNTPTITGTAEAGATVVVTDAAGNEVGSATADANGNYSITTSELDDGEQNLTITSTDIAGNTATDSQTFTVDTAAQSGTVSVNPITNDDVINGVESTGTVAVSGKAEGGDISAGDEVSMEINGTTYKTTVDADGNWSVDVAGSDLAADTEFTVDVKSSDAAGNEVTSSVTSNHAVDTSVESLSADIEDASDTGASNSDNITKDNTPTISGTTEAGATVVITDAAGNVVGSATADSNGAYSITTDELNDGTQDLTIKATDTAGNVSTVTQSITVDTVTSNSVDMSDESGDDTINASEVATSDISGNVEAGSTINSLIITDGSNSISVNPSEITLNADGSYSIDNVDVSSLNDGNLSVTVISTDVAGNTSSNTDSISKDTSVSGLTADIEDGSDTGASNTDNVTSDNTPTITGTTEAGAVVVITDKDGKEIGSATADSNGNYSITTQALEDGAQDLTVTATDTAGNTTSTTQAITVDTNADAATISFESTGDDNVYNAAEVGTDGTITATIKLPADAGAGDILSINGVDQILTQDDIDAKAVTTEVAPGATVTATITDLAGNQSTVSGTAAEQDLSAEAGTVSVNPITNDDVINGVESTGTVAVSGKAEGGDISAGDEVSMEINGTTYKTTVDADGNWSVDVAGSDLAADTEFTVDVKSSDAAGNEVTSSADSTHSVDTSVESLSADIEDASDTGASNSDNITKDNTPTISGTTEAGATVVITDAAGNVVGSATADSNGAYSITTDELNDGTQDLTIKATDTAGNVSTVTQSITVDTVTSNSVDMSDESGDDTINASEVATSDISGNVEAGSTINSLIITDGSNSISVNPSEITLNADGSYSIDNVDVSSLNDGNLSVTVISTDVAGNTSSNTDSISKDTSVSGLTADIEDGSDTGASNTDNVTSDNTPTITGTTEAGAVVVITDKDGKEIGSATADSNGNYSITTQALEDGAQDLTVTATDTAGNTTSTTQAITVDTNADAATISFESTGDDNVYNAAEVGTDGTITATIKLPADAGAGDILSINGVDQILTQDDIDAKAVTTEVAPGATVTATITDLAGNQSTVSGTAAEQDLSAEAGTVSVNPITNDDVINGVESTGTVAVSGKAEGGDISAGDEVSMEINGTTYKTTVDADGNWSVDVAGSDLAADTEFTVDVKSSDAAGNEVTSSVTSNHAVDTSVESLSADIEDASDTGASNSDNITKDNTPTISGTTEAGATVVITDAAGNVVGSATADSNGAYSITTDELNDGTQDLTIKATDTAGNVSTVTQSITVDTVTSNSVDMSDESGDDTINASEVATSDISGNVEAGSTINSLIITDGSNSISVNPSEITLNADGSYSIDNVDVSSLNDGNLSVTVISTDVAGNTSSNTDSISKDTSVSGLTADIEDGSDTGASNTDNVTSDNTPTITGTTEAGAVVVITDKDGKEIGSATADSNGNYSITTQALEDGAQDLTVTATDTAGNTTSTTQAITVDTNADAATISFESTGDDNVYNAAEVGTDGTITATIKLPADAGAGDILSINGVDQILTQDDIDAKAVTTEVAPGATVTATITDLAGNQSTVSGTAAEQDLSAEAGTVSVNPITNDDVINGVESTGTVAVSGKAEGGDISAGDEVSMEINGTTYKTTVDADGNWSVDVAGSDLAADTEFTVDVKSSDAAGNEVTSSATSTHSVDTDIAPVTVDLATSSDTGLSDTDNITKDNTPTITGTAEAGSTVVVTDSNGNEVGTAVADSDGNYSITTTELNDGAQNLTVTSTDSHGNSATAVQAITIDTQIIEQADSEYNGYQEDYGVSGSGGDFLVFDEPGSKIIEGTGTLQGNYGTLVLNEDGSYTYSVNNNSEHTQGLKEGELGQDSFTYTVSDPAGNTYTKTVTYGVTGRNDDVAELTDTNVNDNVIAENAANGSEVGIDVNAIDVDGDAITYSIVDSDGNAITNGAFEIDPTTGVVTVADSNQIDYENASSQTIIVKAQSADGSSVQKEFTIGITDVDDTIDQVTADIEDGSDTGASNTDNVTSDNTPTITGTTEAGAVVVITDKDGKEIGSATADSNGNYSITTQALEDGAQDLTVTATDTAGNTTSTTQAITVDTNADAATISFESTGDDNVYNAAEVGTDGTITATIKLPADAGAGDILSINGVEQILTQDDIDAKAVTTEVAPGATVTATITDLAGNQSTVSGTAAEQDLSAEAGTVSVNPITNDDVINGVESTGTVAVSGKAEGGDISAGDEVSMEINGTTYKTTVDADGNWSVDVAGSDLAADTEFTVDVKSSDAAGNEVTSSADSTHSVDTSVESLSADIEDASDTGASNSDNITKDNTPTISGTTEAGATVVITDAAGNVVGSATADSNGAYSITTDELNDGTQDLTIKATDTAGNVSTVTQSITVDTVTSNSVDMSDESGDDTINASEVATSDISGNVEAGSTINSLIITDGSNSISVNPSEITLNADGSYSIDNVDVSSLNDGNLSVTVISTDVAGNTSSNTDSISKDTSVSGLTADIEDGSDTGASNTDNVTSDNTPTITGTTEAGAVVVITDKDGKEIGSATADSNGNYSITTQALEDGAQDLTVTATDTAGNTTSTTQAITVDTNADAATISFESTGDDNVYNAAEVGTDGTITATIKLPADAGAGDILSINGVDQILTQDDIDAKAVTTEVAPGATVTATITDLAGNQSTVSGTAANADITVAKPVISDVIDTNGDMSEILLKGTQGEVGSTIKVFDQDDNLVGTTTVKADGTWEMDIGSLDNDKNINLKAVQIDSVGNESEASDVVHTYQSDSTHTYTEAGDDYIFTGSGNDYINVKSSDGDVVVDGGAGTDTARFHDSDAGVNIDLSDNQTETGGAAEGLELRNIENIYGSDHNDTIVGDDGNNLILGDDGSDTLEGGAGDDRLYGDHPNFNNADDGDTNEDDTLIGGAGNDLIYGGIGTDTAVFSGDMSDYSFKRINGTTIQVIDNRPDSPDGTDTVYFVEKLQFADQTVDAHPPAVKSIVVDKDSDTGTHNTDAISNDTTPTINIELPSGANVGDVITIYAYGSDDAHSVNSPKTKLTLVEHTLTQDDIDNGSISETVTVNEANGEKIVFTASVTQNGLEGFDKSPMAVFTLDTEAQPIESVEVAMDTNSDGFVNKEELGDKTNLTSKINLPDDISDKDTLIINGNEISISAENVSNGYINYNVPSGVNELEIAVKDVAGNVSDTVTVDLPTIDVSVENPTVTFLGDTNSDGVFNSAEVGTDGKLDAKIELPADFNAQNDTLIINGENHTLSSEEISQGYVTVEVPVDNPTVSASIKDQAGNISDTVTQTATIDTQIEEGDVTVNSITADDILNQTEATGEVNVSGTAQGGDISSGDEVSMIINGTTYKTTVDADGNWSVNVAGSDLEADTEFTVNVVSSDAAGNEVTSSVTSTHAVDTTVGEPTISILGDVNSDGIFNVIEVGPDDSVTARVSLPDDFNASQDTLTINGATYNVSASEIANGYVDVELPIDNPNISASITDAVGNKSDTVSESVAVDIVAQAGTVEVNSITDDDVINSTELGQTITVTGTANGGDISSGDEVSMVINGTTYKTTVDDNGNWSVNVAGSDLAADKSFDVSVASSDTAGNSVVSTANSTHTVDTVAEQVTADIADASDTGASNTDNITSDNTPTITGTTEAGSTVVITDAAGNNIGSATADSNGNYSITTSALDDGTQNLKVTATDSAGNTTTTTQSITVDTGNSGVTSKIEGVSTVEDSGNTTTSWDGVADMSTEIIDSATETISGNANNSISKDGSDDKIDISGSTYGSIDLGEGNNTLDIGNSAGQTISAGSGDDTVRVDHNANKSINLGDGNNQVEVGNSTYNTITTGTGDDKVKVGTDASAVNLGDGDNELEIGRNANKEITVGDGDDKVLVGGSTYNTVDLGDGDNYLEIKDDANVINAGSGSDNVKVADNANKAIDLGDGTNNLDIGGSAHGTITTGSGNDTVTVGVDANKEVTLGDGNDSLDVARNANKAIDSGDGNDHIVIGGDVNSTVNLGNGNDVLEIKDDLNGNGVTAGSGTDFVSVAGSVNADIDMGSGNDYLVIENNDINNAELDGGDGVDSIELKAYSHQDYLNNKDGIQDNIKNFENIKFSDGHVIGDANAFGKTADDFIDNSNDGSGAAITNDNTPTITGTTEAGATVVVTDANGNSVGTATADANGNYSITTSTLNDGEQTLTITSTDVAGNTATDTQTVTIDTVADAGTVTIDDITSDDVINASESNQTISLSGTATGGDISVGDSVTMNINGRDYSTIVNGDGSWNLNVLGSDLAADTSFDVNVASSDAAGNSVTSSVNSTHTVDTEATAQDDINTVQEDSVTTAVGNVLSNDESGSTVTAQTITGTLGTITIASDGSYTYTLDNSSDTVQGLGKGEAMTDSFTYTVTDPAGNTTTAKVNIGVIGTNDAPTIDVASTASVNEDGSVVISPVIDDLDGDSTTVTATATNGTVTVNNDGTLTFNPTADYSGPAQVTVTADDGKGGVTTKTIDVTVSGVVDAPDTADITVGAVVDNTTIVVDNDAMTTQGIKQGDDGNYYKTNYTETAKLYKNETIEVGQAEKIRMDDAPDNGTVEILVDGTWTPMVVGQEYDATSDVRFVPNDNLDVEDTQVGTFGDNVGTYNFNAIASVSDWGTVSNDGKSVTFTDGDLTVKTTVDQNGENQTLGAYNGSGNSRGAGIGDTDADGLSLGEKLVVEISGEDVNQVVFQLDGLGGYFDATSSNATEVKITAYDADGNEITATGGYRESGSYADTYEFTTNVPVARFELTTSGSNGNYVVQNMTLSRTIVDDVKFTAIADDGTELSVTSDINIQDGMPTTSISDLVPVSDTPMTKEVKVVDEDAMADKGAILKDGKWVVEDGTTQVDAPTKEVVDSHTFPVDISASLSDTDGSETMTITITDVPDSATLTSDNLTLVDNNDGTWSVTVPAGTTNLSDSLSIEVPRGESDFTLGLKVTSTENGQTETITDSVAIDVPDIPTAVSESNTMTIDISPDAVVTNLSLNIDVSGSMGWDAEGVEGKTRLEVAKEALVELIEKYDELGDVNVNVTTFSTYGDNHGWMTASEAINFINGLTAGGGTNYEHAVYEQQAEYVAPPAEGNDVSFFISDGNPTYGVNLDSDGNVQMNGSNPQLVGNGSNTTTVDTNSSEKWTGFADATYDQSYAVAIGTGINETYLNALVSNPDNVLVASDMSTLVGELTDKIVTDTFTGNLLDNVTSNDGGLKLTSVAIGDKTYSVDDFPITTPEGAILNVNFATGEYTYQVNSANVSNSVVENFSVTASDVDGDSVTFIATMNVNIVGERSVEGETYNYSDLKDTTLNATENDDTINVSKKIKGNADVDTGAGHDTINVNQKIEGNAVVDTGTGNDTITAQDDIKGNAQINMGDGNDKFETGNDIEGNATIDMGAGDDFVIVDDDIQGNATVKMGSGDDTVKLTGDNGGDDGSKIEDNAQIDFGTGNDTLIMEDDITFDFEALAEQVKNLEAIDLENSQAQNLDAISASDVIKMTDDDNVLKILGDDADQVGLDKDSWSKSNQKVTEEGETFDVWTNDNVTVYVDEDIQVVDI